MPHFFSTEEAPDGFEELKIKLAANAASSADAAARMKAVVAKLQNVATALSSEQLQKDDDHHLSRMTLGGGR